MSDYVNVYDSQPNRPGRPNETSWLDELLAANHIPYRTEQEAAWTGWSKAPDYNERTKYYVPDNYARHAKELIQEYLEEAAVCWDEAELFPEGIENQLPMLTCPRCGKEFEMDYPSCPFCR